MTTTWKIFDMKRHLSTGLVTEVRYGCVVDHPKGIERELGILNIDGNPKSPDFIMFEDLDKETVLGWVYSALGQDKVAAIEAKLQTKLSTRVYELNNPTEGRGIPW